MKALTGFFTLLGVAALAITARDTQAQTLFTSGHGDIGVGYEAGAFDPHWHLDDLGEFAPDEARAVVQSLRPSPSGLSLAIGVADGTDILVAGSSANQPNLGLSTEELEPSDWEDGQIAFSLTSWTGPGEFALYTTNGAGTVVTDIYLSTFSAASTLDNNSFALFAGDHLHFAFGFTLPGNYELEFTWSGTHLADGFKMGSATFGFTAVPEPSVYVLLGIAASAVIFFRGRHARP